MRQRRGLILQIGLMAMAVLSVVYLRDELPSPSAVWEEIRTARPAWLILIVFTEVLSMASFSRLQHKLLSGGGVQVSYRRVMAVTYAGNAISATLPAGPAMSMAYAFRRWRERGASKHLSTAAVLIAGAATTVSYTLVTLVFLLAEPGSRLPALSGLTAIAALGGLAALGLRHPAFARARGRAIGWALGGKRVGPLVAELQEGWRVLRLTPSRWAMIAALAMTVWLLDITGVVAATHAVGLNLDPVEVALAYFTAQATGSVLPLLPGGLGAIEASMTASMVGFGALAVPAGAAVMLYRLVSFWGIVAAGWGFWLVLRLNGTMLARMRAFALAAALSFAAASGYAAAAVSSSEPVELS
ncbi:MAG: lysylphosphatidylglycerol synthase transmembrane domain-containing protein [Streptosporangiaceae bacterium]